MRPGPIVYRALTKVLGMNALGDSKFGLGDADFCVAPNGLTIRITRCSLMTQLQSLQLNCIVREPSSSRCLCTPPDSDRIKVHTYGFSTVVYSSMP